MYASYNDYLARYSAITDHAQFELLEARAADMIDVVTHNRAASATGYKLERVKMCAIELINLLATESTGLGSGVSSFSNDGYSESYALTTQAGLEENRRQLMMRCLSGTGLVSAL